MVSTLFVTQKVRLKKDHNRDTEKCITVEAQKMYHTRDKKSITLEI